MSTLKLHLPVARTANLATMALPDRDLWAVLEHLDYARLRYLQDSGSNETATSTSSASSPTNSGQPLKDALTFYGSLFAVGFVLYCYFRKRIPRTYAVRQWVPSIKTPLADNQFGYINWVWKVYSFSAEELIETVGLDGLCFLRLMSMGFRFACVGAFNSIWLFPVYATAEKDPDSEDNVVNYLSFNILQDGSPRFIATVMAAYVFFGYTMYTMLKEFTWFNEQRYKWLRRFKQQNYSILVRNIPKDLRSNELLLGYFQSVYGPERGTKLIDCQTRLDEVLSILIFLPSFHSPRGPCVCLCSRFRSHGSQ